MKSMILAAGDPMDHVLPHRFGSPLVEWTLEWSDPLGILTLSPHASYFTNHLLMTLVAFVIMLLIFPMLGRRYAAMMAGAPEQNIPSGFTNLIESMMQFVRNEVARPVLEEKTDRFMPFLWTMFFYILICNLLGMIPLDVIIGSLTNGGLTHIGGTATGNIMITAGLAICSFIMIHFSGVKQVYTELVAGTYGHHGHDDDHGDHGHHGHPQGKSAGAAMIAAPFLYVWNFAPHVFAPEKITGVGSLLLYIADVIMWAILLVLEGVGAIIKPFALAIRLFANMVAGHVVLASILLLASTFDTAGMKIMGGGVVILGCAALSCLELFVAFLQAYIFTFLTTLFIGASVAPEH